jgi:hypothetical protein
MDISQDQIRKDAEALAALIQDAPVTTFPLEFEPDAGIETAPWTAEFVIAGPGGEPRYNITMRDIT